MSDITVDTVKSESTQKLIDQFGVQPISPELIERIKKYTKKDTLSHFIERGIFMAHRDLDHLLTQLEKNPNEKVYLYTGRGPSSTSLHLGHLLPFTLTLELQRLFDCPVVIQITDDEKYLKNQDGKSLDEISDYGRENIKDIMTIGFDPKNTFVFTNRQYINFLYPNILKIQKSILTRRLFKFFGSTDNDSIGKVNFPTIQMAPCCPSSFPTFLNPIFKWRCLIPCALDQDPYFRLFRDIASSIKEKKPALIYSKFLPSLLGRKEKMSSSVDKSAIFLNDTPKQIKKKINSYAFSGGQDTAELQAQLGANLDVDVAISYLEFFMEDHQRFLEICQQYKDGKLMTGEVKKITIEIIIKVVSDFQENRFN